MLYGSKIKKIFKENNINEMKKLIIELLIEVENFSSDYKVLSTMEKRKKMKIEFEELISKLREL